MWLTCLRTPRRCLIFGTGFPAWTCVSSSTSTKMRAVPGRLRAPRTSSWRLSILSAEPAGFIRPSRVVTKLTNEELAARRVCQTSRQQAPAGFGEMQDPRNTLAIRELRGSWFLRS